MHKCFGLNTCFFIIVLLLIQTSNCASLHSLEIKADSITIDNEKQMGLFTGNVEAIHENFTLKAQGEVQVLYDIKGKVKSLYTSSEILLQGDEIKISAKEAEYDVTNGVVILRKEVRMHHAIGTIFGTEAMYNIAKQTVEIKHSVVQMKQETTNAGSLNRNQ